MPFSMAACIIVAQVVRVPVAMLASHYAAIRRRRVFLITFAILPLRGWLYTLTEAPGWLIAIQAPDAVRVGIFGVVSVLMIADLTQGTGRFNLAQGLVATAIGLGAAASNLPTGRVADAVGFNAGILVLSGAAVIAFAVFLLRVTETGPHTADGAVLDSSNGAS